MNIFLLKPPPRVAIFQIYQPLADYFTRYRTNNSCIHACNVYVIMIKLGVSGTVDSEDWERTLDKLEHLVIWFLVGLEDTEHTSDRCQTHMFSINQTSPLTGAKTCQKTSENIQIRQVFKGLHLNLSGFHWSEAWKPTTIFKNGGSFWMMIYKPLLQ